MVKDVYIFENGIVAVCDEKGEQLPDLQGRWEDKAKDIFNHCTYETIFNDQRSFDKRIEH